MVKNTLAFALLLAGATAGGAQAGPDLDRILNYMRMDQSVPMKAPQLLFINERDVQLTREAPIGQTFVTGPQTATIVRIRVQLFPTGEWKPGEAAELTLWDGPEKKNRLGGAIVRYESRYAFPFKQMEWFVNADAQPNTSYYFEITYAGEGDGKLGVVGVMYKTDAYKPGRGYLAGKPADFDLCFQTHSRSKPDRVGNLKRMFSKINLNYPGLEGVKKAVAQEDFDTAVAKTVAYFENRKERPIIRPEDVPKPIQSDWAKKADDLMNANWRQVDMEGFGAKKVFCHAYLDTGDNKYAAKMNDLMMQWFIENPPPSESGVGGHPWDGYGWASLSVGSRIGGGFLAYSYLHASPAFTTDCRMAYIISLADHCETLMKYGAYGGDSGNWSFLQNSYLLQFAVNYPQFRDSAIWQTAAADRLMMTFEGSILPDGVEEEASPGYEGFAYNALAVCVYDDLIVSRGLKTPFSAQLRGVLEKQAEHFMHNAMPNGISPYLGDWGHGQAREGILREARRFSRKDMLYVATAGKNGRKPKEVSKLYPCAGIVTMRSDWGDAGRPFDDARYLMLHGVHFGGHGHQDLNGISALYAYGRELLTDPGSHVYGSPEHKLLTEAVSHNLLTIDGQDQNRQGKTAFHSWSTTPVADYISSYVEAYKGGDYTREVFYIRANGDPGAKEYWVVRDTAGGTGTHSLEQRWHFVLDSAPEPDPATLETRTAFPDKGNLAILQVDPSRLQVEQTTIDCWQDRASMEQPPSKLPTVIYKTTAVLPAAIDTVLLPFEGVQKPPVNLKVLETSADRLDTVFKVVQERAEDLFVLQSKVGAKELPTEKVSFEGERLFVRRIGGRLRSALLVNGSSLSVDGREIVKSAKRLSWVAVSFEVSGVKAYASAKEPTLTVPAAKGRKVSVQSAGMDQLLGMCRQGKRH